jgi:hypothetical protein
MLLKLNTSVSYTRKSLPKRSDRFKLLNRKFFTVADQKNSAGVENPGIHFVNPRSTELDKLHIEMCRAQAIRTVKANVAGLCFLLEPTASLSSQAIPATIWVVHLLARSQVRRTAMVV